jgi:hypothetical protein
VNSKEQKASFVDSGGLMLVLETDNIIIKSFVWWDNGVDFSLNDCM